MKIDAVVREEHGFTLIETLVAMTIFLSVVIPFLVMMNNLLIDGTADQMRTALYAAETEITRSWSEKDFSDGARELEHGLQVKRSVQRQRNLITIHVDIVSKKRQEKIILSLTKSFLAYQ